MDPCKRHANSKEFFTRIWSFSYKHDSLLLAYGGGAGHSGLRLYPTQNALESKKYSIKYPIVNYIPNINSIFHLLGSQGLTC
jgi:hypothetical protein